MALLFFMVIVLITYGSLYPFNFTFAAPDPQALEDFIYSRSLLGTRGDILGNIALFVPYGFLGMLALPPRRSIAARFILLSVIGLVVAAGVQALQLLLPTRDAVLGDVLWNILGWTIGALLIAPRPVRTAIMDRAGSGVAMLPLALIACWYATELVPFIPSIDFQAFKSSLKPLLLNPTFTFIVFFRAYVAWLVVAYLITQLVEKLPTWLLLLGGMVALLAAKVIVIENFVTVADVAAAAAAFASWVLLLQFLRHKAAVISLILVAFLGYAALEPFNFRAFAQEFHWIPFSGSLTGSMIINAKAMAGKAFLIGALVYLLTESGFRLRTSIILSVVLTAALEVAQRWIWEHTAEVTDPLVAVLMGIAIAALSAHAQPAAQSNSQQTAARKPHGQHGSSPGLAVANGDAGSVVETLVEEAQRPVSGPRHDTVLHPSAALAPERENLLSWHRLALLVLGCAAVAIIMKIILGLSRIPYNVGELFGGANTWWKLIFFALAVLSIGMGGAFAGQVGANSRRPYLALPGAVVLACFLTYLLLVVSVTSESLLDVTGSANTYYFVTNENMWGDFGIWLYGFIGSRELIDTVERFVRFLTLVGPIFIWLAILDASHRSLIRRPQMTGMRKAIKFTFSFLLYAFYSLPWLILFKMTTFDLSSTDNLNELIGDNGHILYPLLILISANAVMLVHASRTFRPSDFMAAALVLAISLPIGWFLFKNGLTAEVHKYGLVYSGVDFLLGPDRKQSLPEAVLMLRWFAVHLAMVAVIAYGMRILPAFHSLGSRTPRDHPAVPRKIPANDC